MVHNDDDRYWQLSAVRGAAAILAQLSAAQDDAPNAVYGAYSSAGNQWRDRRLGANTGYHRGVLVAHLVEVTLYTAAYYASEKWMGLGRIDGEIEEGSSTTSTFQSPLTRRLGVGDLHPRGPLRLIAGVESLNGLVLIGCSASFTYLAMGQIWQDVAAPELRRMPPTQR